METVSNIPVLHQCALAFHMDIKQKKEILLLGEKEEIRKYLSGVAQYDLLLKSERPIGSFLHDCTYFNLDAMKQIQNDLFILVDGQRVPDTWEDSLRLLEDYYTGMNFALRFLTLAIWQRYTHFSIPSAKIRWRKQREEDAAARKVFDAAIGELTFPFRYTWNSDASNLHASALFGARKKLLREFYIQESEIIFEFHTDAKEYLLIEHSLLPVILYCLRTSKQVGWHFVQCLNCGTIFMAKGARAAYCSTRCKRRVQGKVKQHYEEKIQDISYEKSERATHMYWYNRIKKWQGIASYSNRMPEINKAFDSFKKEKSKKKKQVKDNALTASEFENWLLASRDIIDDFEMID